MQIIINYYFWILSTHHANLEANLLLTKQSWIMWLQQTGIR